MEKCWESCCFSLYSSILKESNIIMLLPAGRIIVLDTIHSTNQYILDNLKYIQSGDVVATEYQTKGRGQRGNFWITPYRQSICLSIYWKLYKASLMTINLNLMVSLAVMEVLKKLGVLDIKIKWPNDLYIDNRKLAGILIEIITENKNISHLVIGIGINISICIRTRCKIKISENWIDLHNIGINPNLNMLVVDLVDMIRQKLKQFEYNKYVTI